MRSSAVGLGLLASAFSPLLVALVLVTHPLPGWWWDAALAAFFALPVLLLGFVRRGAVRLGGERLDIQTATPRDSDVLTFLGSYLVPIAIVFFVAPELPRIAAMLVLLVLLVTVYARAQLFWLNPFLPLAGYRVYQVVTVEGETVMLITRKRRLFNATIDPETGRPRPSSIARASVVAGSIRFDLEGER